MNSLIQKYNIPGPRYTSYPTVPYWDNETFSKEKWIETFKHSFIESNSSEGISLYIHLPFCESLCTFCACHKHITKRHEMEDPYIETVLKEWQLYVDLVDETPIIKEIHLGGGTPTFFSEKQLKRLIDGIFINAEKHPDHEFSFEGHPNNTTKEHLQTLYNIGFTRVSFGVQDYNPKVQEAIHRVQPFENVEKVHNWAKEIGYTSISHDLVFGLPFQTKENVIYTINKTKELEPDRISFYSYAHVPWVKGVGQRGFNEDDLPKNEEKRELYEIGKELFAEMGYVEIGMDHFALPTDSLYKATKEKTLHRNFMGYTANKTQLMVGLGMSSISDSWYGFAQNVKTVKEYGKIVNEGEIPVFRGHILSEEDLIIRKHILNIMCHFSTSWEEEQLQIKNVEAHIGKLKEMIDDGLVSIKGKKLTVPEKARPYVRNICMAFDKKLHEKQPEIKLFSMTI
ncbi:oxygen-independent coproporphyrinogen III oxidase [Tenacibaculum discolor]|uniref:Coproporphyrinogen-III oxidase n=1 Tax=Tenacibaculum discolor TaxID=361581 RepID=A0A2G1BYS9_9FLAO|nr:oxygen-independent coproporphyrinogen III oxidase [Tenacibaculum discolor]MDP2541257.1 oxygen-independent coproporphyrinogen III oxidase [Tenacibaculum discolor]PHN99039.1 oxygen-independent coproporphyrinogen III oxidase [Tenacibaculum discolor]PHO01144.1 oxygen-independent coproporphyrinogen III oxidase [Rhodobacteraceae bacterium 4F10]